jgi:hypothetical protein
MIARKRRRSGAAEQGADKSPRAGTLSKLSTRSGVKADASWRTYEVDGGHDVMVDRPERLVEILLEAS